MTKTNTKGHGLVAELPLQEIEAKIFECTSD
jgi:hypothetical protein